MLTRRTVLTGAPAAALLPVPSLAAENAAGRVQRLCRELSEALDDFCGGDFYAEVFPAHQTTADGVHRSYQFNKRLTVDERVARHWAELRQAIADRDGIPDPMTITATVRSWHDPNGHLYGIATM